MYRSGAADQIFSEAGTPILIAVLTDKPELLLLVHRRLTEILALEDTQYVEGLLQDFLLQARLRPESLFEQLTELTIGPLIAGEVRADPHLLAYWDEQMEHYLKTYTLLGYRDTYVAGNPRMKAKEDRG
jgi:hypothetical protein